MAGRKNQWKNPAKCGKLKRTHVMNEKPRYTLTNQNESIFHRYREGEHTYDDEQTAHRHGGREQKIHSRQCHLSVAWHACQHPDDV